MENYQETADYRSPPNEYYHNRNRFSQALLPLTNHINRPDTGPYLTKVKTLELNLAKWEPFTQDIKRMT